MKEYQKLGWHQIIVLGICMAFLYSCRSEDPLEPNALFGDAEILKLESEEFTGLLNNSIANPWALQKKGNYISFSDIGTYSMYLYNILSGESIAFARKGIGPGEFVNGASSYGWLNDSTIYCICDQTRKVCFFNTTRLSNNIIIPDTVIRYSNMITMRQVLYKDTSRIGLNVMSQNPGLFGWSTKDEDYSFFSEYPNDVNTEKSPMVRFLAYQGRLIMNQDSNVLCFSSRYAGFLVISQIKDGTIQNTIWKSFWEPQYTTNISESEISANPNPNESRFGFLSSAIGTKHIYLLYSGKKQHPKTKPDYPRFHSDIILVFDFEGNPVRTIKLDIMVCEIGISEEEDSIFAFSNDPFLKSHVFQLKPK